ncbi:MAG: SDR family oxidoreductase [Bdellovibrio sp.]|nr:SDR family oxidoreductase [Bdellovibrio sp.]
MNKKAKNELMFLMGLGALASVLFGRKKLAAGLALGTAAVAFSKKKSADSFDGKVAVITGGSRGLGLALAKKLVIEGSRVTLLARDLGELEKAKEHLSKFTSADKICIFQCDVTDQEQMIEALRTTVRHWGSIDLLINNAGAIIVGPFESMTMTDFEAQMKLHVYANIHATNEILPIFRRRGGGRIINICSMGGKVAVPHMLPYNTSKFALSGFSQGITAELSRENISVTTVYPALMRTGSPIQAVFKGDAEKEFAWFANADVLPGLSLDAHDAANQIIEASRDRQTELVPSLIGRVRMMAAVLFPELMQSAMGLMNRLMPRRNSFNYRTGAQAQTKDSYVLKSLQRRAESAEADLNQTEKHNPEFNLGIQ